MAYKMVVESKGDNLKENINILDDTKSSFFSDFCDFVMVSCDLNKCLSKKKSYDNV